MTLILCTNPHRRFRHLETIGWLYDPGSWRSVHGIVESGKPWAADNGCFTGLKKEQYVRMLKKCSGQPNLLWVTAPDVVGDSVATRLRFRLWKPVLQYFKLPIAFVAQDGETEATVPWDDIVCLFIGGTTGWKISESAAILIRAAKARGKWVHVGRVSTHRRIDYLDSLNIEIDSFDSTAFSRIPNRLRGILERLEYRQETYV
jgi:hypothetical protein